MTPPAGRGPSDPADPLDGLPATPPPGDPFRFTTLAHAGRANLGPLDDADLDALVAALPLAHGARAMDLGCGKGELLVRLAVRGVTGLGVDHNPWHIRDAVARAAAAGVADRIDWLVADAQTVPLPDPLDLVACIGASGAIGGPIHAPESLAELVRPGGLIVLGEGYWRVPPETVRAISFGIRPGEMLPHAETLERMTAAGLELVAVRDSGEAAWERYERAYADAIGRWAAASPDDPDRGAFLERIAFMGESWATWRRDAMGFLVAVLRRP